MSRNTMIVSGAAILGVGLVITLGTMSAASSGGGYVFAWGAILVGLVRIVRGFAQPPDEVAEIPADQLVGRYGPDDPEPQLAGAKCVHCSRKITSALEAMACKKCNQPIHIDCKDEHRAEAHEKRSAVAPYR